MVSTLYRFGDFRLDPASRELWRGDEELAVPRKVFDCIVYLIEHRDHAVERDELFAAVWGDVQLSDGVLAQTILEARKALHDTGDGQLFIKTIRGFGYHWAATVETVGTSTEQTTRTGRQQLRSWVLTTLLIVGPLAGATLYMGRDRGTTGSAGTVSPPREGSIALLLPIEVEADDDHAWIRLGLMDMIAMRLRDAGQAMVPSDTVIALLRDHASEPGQDELSRLTATTGTHLVLKAQAQLSGTRWTVSLHSLLGARPPLTAVSEASDVLKAARAAADRLALSLGLEPAPDPSAAPGLAMLLRKIGGAILAQQMQVARELIETAGADLREHPEVRLQLARIEYHSFRLAAAQEEFESLLVESAIQRDPKLRALVLYGLGAVCLRRGDYPTAESFLNEASGILPENAIDAIGRIRLALSLTMMMAGDSDKAGAQMARARMAFEATGDVDGLATLDNNMGVLAAHRERYADALHYFKSAADRAAALRDIGSELRNLANVVEIQLGLLEPQAASAVQPRLNELLAQTTNPQIVAIAKLDKANLLAINGRSQAAERLLSEVLGITDAGADLHGERMEALVLRAEQAAHTGDPARAMGLAHEVVEQMQSSHDILLGDALGRAWLILVRGHLAQRDLAAAAEALATMNDWVQRITAPSPKIYAALARAELAVAEHRDDNAEAAFDHALSLADSGQVPLRLLRVAESYVPWLLDRASHGSADSERVLVVADRLARYADRHYGAALLQLRIYHALGPPSAWRSALARARTLAGERQIPPVLQKPPPTHRDGARLTST